MTPLNPELPAVAGNSIGTSRETSSELKYCVVKNNAGRILYCVDCGAMMEPGESHRCNRAQLRIRSYSEVRNRLDGLKAVLATQEQRPISEAREIAILITELLIDELNWVLRTNE